MVLPSLTFRRVLDLPKVNWSSVSDDKKSQVIARCQELLKQLPDIESIESIKRLDGAKYLFEKALMDTLEALGAPITEETRSELLIENFLA